MRALRKIIMVAVLSCVLTTSGCIPIVCGLIGGWVAGQALNEATRKADLERQSRNVRDWEDSQKTNQNQPYNMND